MAWPVLLRGCCSAGGSVVFRCVCRQDPLVSWCVLRSARVWCPVGAYPACTHTVRDVALFPSVHVCLLLQMNGPDRACLSSACPSLSVCAWLHGSRQRWVHDELSPPCQVPTWSRTWSYSSSLGSPCSSWSWRWGSGSAGAALVSGITSVPALGALAMPAAW